MKAAYHFQSEALTLENEASDQYTLVPLGGSFHNSECSSYQGLVNKLLEVKLHNDTISMRRGNGLSPSLTRAFITEVVYSSYGTLIIQLTNFGFFFFLLIVHKYPVENIYCDYLHRAHSSPLTTPTTSTPPDRSSIGRRRLRHCMYYHFCLIYLFK